MGLGPQSFLGDSLRLVYAENTGAFLSMGEATPPLGAYRDFSRWARRFS